MNNFLFTRLLYRRYCPAREADSGVVTDAGPDPGLSSNNSRLSVLSTVSASVSLDNLYLGEEADTSSDQSNRLVWTLASRGCSLRNLT